MTNWDVFHSDRLEVERGLTTEAIRRALAAGLLRDDDLARPAGSDIAWTAIADIAELIATAPSSAPPPVSAPLPPTVDSSAPPPAFDPTHDPAEFTIPDFVVEDSPDFEEMEPDAGDDEVEMLDALDILEDDGEPAALQNPDDNHVGGASDLELIDEADLVDAREQPFDPLTLFELDDDEEDEAADANSAAARGSRDDFEGAPSSPVVDDPPSVELDIEPDPDADPADMPAGAFDLRPGRLDAIIDDSPEDDDDEVYFVGVPEPLPGEDEEDDPLDEDEAAAEFTLARGKADTVEELDLAAMVDVAFQLVLFFLVTATTILYKSLEIPRPNADAPNPGAVQGQSRSLEDLKDDYILVEIDSSGGVKIDREAVAASMSALVENLRAARERTNRTSMLLSADFNTPHKNAVMAYDAASEIGLGIAIANPTPPAPSAPAAAPPPPAQPAAPGG